MTDDAQAFASLMQGRLDPQRIADGVRFIESAQTQYSAVGRITAGALNIEVQLELTSGESRAFKGTALGFFADGSVEIGGYVYTTESANLFDLTRSFAMLLDGSHLYFYTKELTVLGHFHGTAGHGLGHSPAFGDGQWFAV
jgi:hypothetical protein